MCVCVFFLWYPFAHLVNGCSLLFPPCLYLARSSSLLSVGNLSFISLPLTGTEPLLGYRYLFVDSYIYLLFSYLTPCLFFVFFPISFFTSFCLPIHLRHPICLLSAFLSASSLPSIRLLSAFLSASSLPCYLPPLCLPIRLLSAFYPPPLCLPICLLSALLSASSLLPIHLLCHLLLIVFSPSLSPIGPTS